MTEPIRTAAALCRQQRIKLRPEGQALLCDDLSPRQFFDRLLEHGCYADARRVLAHSLPKRRALWWGCLCALDAYRPAPPPLDEAVLQTVVQFVQDPTEANRRAVVPLAKEAGMNSLTGCLAMAAFFSDGSISRPGLPFVPARPFVTGRLVGVAVYLAAVRRDPAHYRDHLRQYLALGLEVARGNNLWTAAVPVAVACPVLPGGHEATAEGGGP
jgi:hypothetical protein